MEEQKETTFQGSKGLPHEVNVNKKWAIYMLIWGVLLWPIIIILKLPIFGFSTRAIGMEGLLIIPLWIIIIVVSLIILRVLYKKLYKTYTTSNVKVSVVPILIILFIIFSLYFFIFDDLPYDVFQKATFTANELLIKNIINAFFLGLLFTNFSFVLYLLSQKLFLRKANKKNQDRSLLNKNISRSSLKIYITSFIVLLLAVIYINFNIYEGPYCEDNMYRNGLAVSLYEINCNLHGGEILCIGTGSACGLNKTSDVGKPCTSSDQCEGLCVMPKSNKEEFKCSDYMPPIEGSGRVIETW